MIGSVIADRATKWLPSQNETDLESYRSQVNTLKKTLSLII